MSGRDKTRFLAFCFGIALVGLTAGPLAGDGNWSRVIPLLVGGLLIIASQMRGGPDGAADG